MPEIAEVARIVHYIRKHLVGKTLSKVSAQDDNNVYGKVGTSAAEFQKAMTGKKVVGAGQQGKYFWMEMSSPPHPLMHFGMTGWLKISTEETYYYKSKEETREWPPKFWKFLLETKEEPKTEAAFVDSRRFGRVRLVDCKAEDIRKVSPLKENGPDPVIDRDLLTEEWLVKKLQSKKVPIKALLLDQANISGIGNWVGDEIMYHAKIHPEQYSNTLTAAQMKQLHKSILHICSTAVDLLSDSDRFPEEWLFKHRWGKGKKDQPKKLPTGEKIIFLTVGGRTSAVIPSVQKKTGPVSKDVDDDDADETDEIDDEVVGKSVEAKEKSKAKSTVKREKVKGKAPNGTGVGEGRGKKGVIPKDEEEEKPAAGNKRKVKEEMSITKKPSKKAKGTVNGEIAVKTSSTKQNKVAIPEEASSGQRRSGRTRV